MKNTIEIEYIDLLRAHSSIGRRIDGFIDLRDRSIKAKMERTTIEEWNRMIDEYKESQNRIKEELDRARKGG